MTRPLDELHGAQNMKGLAISAICRLRDKPSGVDLIEVLEAITYLDYERELEQAKGHPPQSPST
jgi:hypothetical protein